MPGRRRHRPEPCPQSTGTSGEVLSDDFGSSVEREALGQVLWQEQIPADAVLVEMWNRIWVELGADGTEGVGGAVCSTGASGCRNGCVVGPIQVTGARRR
jgi:hypothetical protein